MRYSPKTAACFKIWSWRNGPLRAPSCYTALRSFLELAIFLRFHVQLCSNCRTAKNTAERSAESLLRHMMKKSLSLFGQCNESWSTHPKAVSFTIRGHLQAGPSRIWSRCWLSYSPRTTKWTWQTYQILVTLTLCCGESLKHNTSNILQWPLHWTLNIVDVSRKRACRPPASFQNNFSCHESSKHEESSCTHPIGTTSQQARYCLFE